MARFTLTLLAGLLAAGCASAPMQPQSEPQSQVLLFDVDSAALRPASRTYLDQLSNFLKDNPDYDVVVEGYTDSTASDEYNLKLSERRAQAVQSHLAANGIAPERCTSVAYGEQRPVDDNKTKTGRQLNRRVVVSAVQREMVAQMRLSGPPKYNYTSTDPKIEGRSYNSGTRPTHR